MDWRKSILILLTLLGVFFRFYDLGSTVCWDDEVATLTRVSGHTSYELFSQLGDSQIIHLEELRRFQYPAPDSSIFGTVRSLVKEDPQHPPLYFLGLRLWMQVFGESLVVARSFSAVTSILVIPAVFWLCFELFGAGLVGWVAMAIVSLSPLELVYAQVAREYNLWLILVFLSSASLLRALRVKTRSAWIVYTIALVVGLYTHIFFVLVVLSHLLAVAMTWRRSLANLIRSIAVAGFCFLPWALVLLSHRRELGITTVWSSWSRPVYLILRDICWNFSRILVDLNSPAPDFSSLGTISFVVCSLAIELYALYVLTRQAPRKPKVFVGSLAGVTLFSLLISDLLLGGQRSPIHRYLIPSFLGVQLALAFMMATLLQRTKLVEKICGTLTALLVLGFQVWSCLGLLHSDTRWISWANNANKEYAQRVNQAANPIIALEYHLVPGVGAMTYSDLLRLNDLLSMTWLLDRGVLIQIIPVDSEYKLPDRSHTLFLLYPSLDFKMRIESRASKAPTASQPFVISLGYDD